MAVQEGTIRWWDKPLASAILGGVASAVLIGLFALIVSAIGKGALISSLGGLTKKDLQNYVDAEIYTTQAFGTNANQRGEIQETLDGYKCYQTGEPHSQETKDNFICFKRR